ncbi:unnamed protein product [Pylaiella littoralis]
MAPLFSRRDVERFHLGWSIKTSGELDRAGEEQYPSIYP